VKKNNFIESFLVNQKCDHTHRSYNRKIKAIIYFSTKIVLWPNLQYYHTDYCCDNIALLHHGVIGVFCKYHINVKYRMLPIHKGFVSFSREPANPIHFA